MKQVYTRLVMVHVKVTVEHNKEEGLYYATAPAMGSDASRQTGITVRSADKETAIHEALVAAGYGDRRA